MTMFIPARGQKPKDITPTFNTIRQALEDTIIDELGYHYIREVQKEYDSTGDKYDNLKIRFESDARLARDLAERNLCEKNPPSKLMELIPRISINFKLTIPESCVVILFLYYGLVLSEQYDDTIDDMSLLLQILVGGKKGKKLYKKIIHIASQQHPHCSEVRRTLLFS